MTSTFPSAGSFQHEFEAPPTAQREPLPEYPRIAEVLERLRTPIAPAQAAPAPAPMPMPTYAPPMPEGPVLPAMAHSIVAGSIATDGVVLSTPASAPSYNHEAVSVIATPAMPAVIAAAPPAHAPAHVTAYSAEVVAPEDVELSDAELDDLIAELGMRDVAREALRARMIAFGENRNSRTAYELVFLMLAFAVTVLIVSPPLVQLALALHGTAPG